MNKKAVHHTGGKTLRRVAKLWYSYGNNYANQMFCKKALSVALGIASMLTLIVSSNLVAHSETNSGVVPQFWVITTNNLQATIGPLIDRYITDITPILQREFPQAQVTKRLLENNETLSSNRFAYQIAATLQNGYYEQRLVGTFLIGLPMPLVKDGKYQVKSLLPYGDFENKYYSFSQEHDAFFHYDSDATNSIKPEILLGYLPDLSTTGFANYFETHHNFITGASAYNQALFFNDPINDQKNVLNLDKAIVVPTGTQQFNPGNYQDALASTKKQWQEALSTTRHWQSGTSLTSAEARTTLEGWYNEPALQTLTNLLPLLARHFLALPTTSDPATLADQENRMGTALAELGAFSSPIAIQSRFFQRDQSGSETSFVCTNSAPFPSTNTEDFQRMRTVFNSLGTWITSIPRGSLLAQAPANTDIRVNGIPVGELFVIRPGDSVSSLSGNAVTLKTILIDPSVIAKDLVIPLSGFRHPGVVSREVPSWNTIEITNEQINELISWNYYLTPADHYIYFIKNRLPPLGQYSFLPDTYEVIVNNVDQNLINHMTSNCLTDSSPETRSIVTLYTGFAALENLNLINDELSSGRSLAVIASNSADGSLSASFDQMPVVPFAGLSSPPLLTSFASGTMLGKSVLPGMNEKLNFFGDPCLSLR